MTAPMTVVFIETEVKPWAVTKKFIPREIWTNTVPMR